MKATLVSGSPRPHGVSAALAQEALNACQAAGLSIETHTLNQLAYKGCQGCWACKKTAAACVVLDGLTKVLADVAQTDLLIITSPVYFHEITGQLKSFFDRGFSYLKPDFMTASPPGRLPPGKKALFIMTHGDPKAAAYQELIDKYAQILKLFGFQEVFTFKAHGLREPEDLPRQPAFLEQLKKTVQSLLP